MVKYNRRQPIDLTDSAEDKKGERLILPPAKEEIVEPVKEEIVEPVKVPETVEQAVPVTHEVKDAPKVEVVHHIPAWAKTLIALAVGVIITGVIAFWYAGKQTQTEPVKIQATKTQDLGAIKTFTASLKKTADATGTPYNVTTETIGGSYVLGITTYNPDKASDMYIDYELTKPEHAVDQATDDTAKKILEELKKDLPTVNKSIVVKDKEKVTMEIYKVEDKYHTVLLYDGEPFAYVVTDKDNVHTNYVTAKYVTEVAAE